MSISNLYQPGIKPPSNLIIDSICIGDTSINTSNQLEMNKKLAMLLPRLTTTERNALTATNGMMIYNTSNNLVETFQNGAWHTGASGTTLAGDVSGPANANTVDFVGGKTASAVATSVNDTIAATNSNISSTIVKRDASGNFSAGTITANQISRLGTQLNLPDGWYITNQGGDPVLRNDTGGALVTTAVDCDSLRTQSGSGNITVNSPLTLTTALDPAYGGTGFTSYAGGDTIYASGLTTLAKLTGNITTTPNYFAQTGNGSVAAPPVWKTPTQVKTDLSLNNVENTALSTWAGSTNITTLGTIGTGSWNATAIGATKGGTGQTTYATGDTLYSSASNTLSKLAGNTTSTKMFLSQTGTGSVSAAPSWLQPAASDLSNGTSGTGSIMLTSAATAWSPVLSDGAGNNFTMSGQQAGYVKFGPLTWFWGHAAWTSLGSAVAGNNVSVTLPSATTPVFYIAFSVGYSSGMGSASQCMGVGSSAQFFKLGGTQIHVSDCSASGEVYFSGMYY